MRAAASTMAARLRERPTGITHRACVRLRSFRAATNDLCRKDLSNEQIFKHVAPEVASLFR